MNAIRSRQQRNFLTTLFLSQGIPMLLGGDELGRTQQGNNNAYCQDNEISWFDWDAVDESLLAFTRRVIEIQQTTRSFAGGDGSRAGRSAAQASPISPGSGRTAHR